jgi:GT2 family glycosyltransferase
MTATAVIPHWNNRHLLETLLRSLREQTPPFAEVIVVDNGSTDDSAAYAEKNGARVIRLDHNAGFAAAVNRGIEAANSEWIAILNNDVVLEPEWLATVIDHAVNANASFATGKILRADDTSIVDGAFDEVSRGGCACRCGSGSPDSTLWNKTRRIRIAPMTAAIFRRNLFSEIGTLDERFVSYMEDIDFGIRCTIAGQNGIYVPSAIAYHRGSATLGAWSSDTVRQISRNQILLCTKHFRGQRRWPMVAGQVLWGLLALRHARGVAWLAGKISGWKAARRIELPVLQEPDQKKIREILAASEEEIFGIEQQIGFDTYWRVYFWLVR